MYEAIYNDNSPVTTGTTCVVSLYVCLRKTVGRDVNLLIDKEMQPLTIIHIVHNII